MLYDLAYGGGGGGGRREAELSCGERGAREGS